MNTSRGRVTTTLASQLQFGNKQTYANESDYTGDNTYQQTTTDDTTVTTAGLIGGSTFTHTSVSYPLSVHIVTQLDDTVTGTQVTTIDQKIVESSASAGPLGATSAFASNEVTPTDTLDISNGSLTGNGDQSSTQSVIASTTPGSCYAQTIKAVANVVTAVTNGSCFAGASTGTPRAPRLR